MPNYKSHEEFLKCAQEIEELAHDLIEKFIHLDRYASPLPLQRCHDEELIYYIQDMLKYRREEENKKG